MRSTAAGVTGNRERVYDDIIIEQVLGNDCTRYLLTRCMVDVIVWVWSRGREQSDTRTERQAAAAGRQDWQTAQYMGLLPHPVQ